jgi:hypothetical protein
MPIKKTEQLIRRKVEMSNFSNAVESSKKLLEKRELGLIKLNKQMKVLKACVKVEQEIIRSFYLLLKEIEKDASGEDLINEKDD